MNKRELRRSFGVGLIVLGAPWIVGCSGSGEAPQDAGDPPQAERPEQSTPFAATIAGAEAKSLSGTAVSYTKGAASPGWALQLAADGAEAITIASDSGSRPASGTYGIIDNTSLSAITTEGEYIASVTLASGASYNAIRGTLVISQSTPSQVWGRFTFTAAPLDGEGAQISVDGTFTSSNKDL